MAPVRPPMKGELFGYAPGRVAFESPPSSIVGPSSNKCILLGGLSDGLMPVPYTSALEDALGRTTATAANNGCGWSLVQPVLSSSYLGFGHGSLDRDCTELDELLAHLVEHRGGESFCLVGHSTGAQDVVHHLRNSARPDLVARIRCVALQAPVSDRESAALCDGCCHASDEEHAAELAAHLELARTMRRAKKEQEMMPRKAFWAPITAARYLDLFDVHGNDDYFSSDLTDGELCERLGHIGALGDTSPDFTCLVACSGSDEYVPATVQVEPLMHRICDAIDSGSGSGRKGGNVAVPLYLPTGNHNLSSRDGADAQTFVETFRELLARCSTQ